MEITVLGSGSAGNCYRLAVGNDTVLLEAGLPFRQIREGLNFRVSALEGCLISHSHGDHARSVNDMVKAGVDCYMSVETAHALNLEGHRVQSLAPRVTVSVGAFRVMPFPLVHDVPNFGYLVAHSGYKAVYITDTFYVPYRFTGLTHILIETNYAPDILRENVRSHVQFAAGAGRIRRTHMSLETVKGFLRANDLSRVEELWLLHLSDRNADGARFKREISEITGKPTYIA